MLEVWLLTACQPLSAIKSGQGEEFLFLDLAAVDSGSECADEVLLRLKPALVGQFEKEGAVVLLGLPCAFHLRFVLRSGQDGVRPCAQARPVRFRHTQQSADDMHGEWGGHVLDEVGRRSGGGQGSRCARRVWPGRGDAGLPWRSG